MGDEGEIRRIAPHLKQTEVVGHKSQTTKYDTGEGL